MTKKLFWGVGIFFSVLLVIVLGLSLFVKSYLKSERLKAIIIPKAEALTGRKVSIDQIHVSLLKGIIVRGISLKESDGKSDFITTKEFILDYSLVPLLRRELMIKKIEIIAPRISVRRGSSGAYNFSDMNRKDRETKKSVGQEAEREKGFPLTVVTDRISIRDATVEFKDDMEQLPDMNARADMEIILSMGRDFKDLKASGTLDLKELKALIGGLQTTTSGKVEVKSESIHVNLSTALGKDTVKLTGTVQDYLESPDITMNISASELNIEKLMAAFGGKKGSQEGPKEQGPASKKTEAGEKGKAAKPATLKASGEIKVGAARYKAYTFKDFAMHYRYAEDLMTIEPLSMNLSGGDQVKTEGTLKGAMQFNAATDVKRTLTGRGSLDLRRCEIRESKIADAMALFTGLDDLRRPRFDSVRIDFSIRDERIVFHGDMTSNLVRMNPAGTVLFDEQLDMLTDVKISPELASKLPTAKITGYLKDEKGWDVIPLKIKGTVEKPSVSLNQAAFGKQIERGIQKEIERRLFHGTPGSKGEQPSKDKGTQDLLKGIFGR
ncbi:MAG TPA: AsmA family protein [Thermodesulfovibrionales bacterium]|nr:AsmA family protein [Thermodesulfovibrionales bacterium]